MPTRPEPSRIMEAGSGVGGGGGGLQPVQVPGPPVPAKPVAPTALPLLSFGEICAATEQPVEMFAQEALKIPSCVIQFDELKPPVIEIWKLTLLRAFGGVGPSTL